MIRGIFTRRSKNQDNLPNDTGKKAEKNEEGKKSSKPPKPISRPASGTKGAGIEEVKEDKGVTKAGSTTDMMTVEGRTSQQGSRQGSRHGSRQGSRPGSRDGKSMEVLS